MDQHLSTAENELNLILNSYEASNTNLENLKFKNNKIKSQIESTETELNRLEKSNTADSVINLEELEEKSLKEELQKSTNNKISLTNKLRTMAENRQNFSKVLKGKSKQVIMINEKLTLLKNEYLKFIQRNLIESNISSEEAQISMNDISNKIEMKRNLFLELEASKSEIQDILKNEIKLKIDKTTKAEETIYLETKIKQCEREESFLKKNIEESKAELEYMEEF